MIKFFKKIRQKLLSENKFSKYLIYAVGEIILVVIGILIALSINNWNQNLNQKEKEINLLKSLKINMERDLEEMNSFIKVQRKIYSSGKLLLDYFDKDLPYQDSLKYHFGNTTSFFMWSNEATTYKTITAIGVDIISNEALRNSIVSYYEYVENSHPLFRKRYGDYLFSSINDILKTRFEGFWYNEGVNDFWKTLDTNDALTTMIPIDFESLKKDQEYRFFLNTIMNMYKWIIEGPFILQSNLVKSNIKQIEEEIEKLEQK